MTNTPRKRLPLPIDEDDRKTMESTIRRGGMTGGKIANPPVSSNEILSPPPAQQVKQCEASTQTADATKLFSRNDLRLQVQHSSNLASAMAEVFCSLDPGAQKFVKPSTMLREFLSENDAALAKLFRESNAGK